jgi:hypothetical protein
LLAIPGVFIVIKGVKMGISGLPFPILGASIIISGLPIVIERSSTVMNMVSTVIERPPVVIKRLSTAMEGLFIVVKLSPITMEMPSIVIRLSLPLSWQKVWIDRFGNGAEMSVGKLTQARMAFYDTPGLTYDSGVHYDDQPAPQQRRSKMAKVKLNLNNLPDVQVIQRANEIKTAMTGNAAFATPTPTLTAVGTAITTAQTALTASDNAATTSKQATANKDTAVDALRGLIMQLATYVELTAAGDEAKILSAGMDVRSARAPSGTPDTVSNLSVTAGDNAGELDLQWDPVAGAKSYEVHTSPDPVTASSWTSQPTVTKSKTAARSLPSGTRVWTRVRAINTAGQGAWSSPASKIVP